MQGNRQESLKTYVILKNGYNSQEIQEILKNPESSEKQLWTRESRRNPYTYETILFHYNQNKKTNETADEERFLP